MSTSDEPAKKDKPVEENEAIPAKVHSANSWENADLGDDERKKKFLKLMGASKSEHHGRFVIGEKDVPEQPHARQKKETDEINRELEDQYRHTMEHRITRHSHKGLGFEDDDKSVGDSTKSADSNSSGNSEKCSDSKEDGDSGECVGKKREHDEPAKDSESPPKKSKMVMNFVKASD